MVAREGLTNGLNLDGALGLSFPAFGDKGLAYSFIGADIDHFPGGESLVGLKAEAGAISQILKRGKLWVGANYLSYFSPDPDVTTYFAKASWATSQDFQLRTSFETRALVAGSSSSLGKFEFNWYY